MFPLKPKATDKLEDAGSIMIGTAAGNNSKNALLSIAGGSNGPVMNGVMIKPPNPKIDKPLLPTASYNRYGTQMAYEQITMDRVAQTIHMMKSAQGSHAGSIQQGSRVLKSGTIQGSPAASTMQGSTAGSLKGSTIQQGSTTGNFKGSTIQGSESGSVRGIFGSNTSTIFGSSFQVASNEDMALMRDVLIDALDINQADKGHNLPYNLGPPTKPDSKEWLRVIMRTLWPLVMTHTMQKVHSQASSSDLHLIIANTFRMLPMPLPFDTRWINTILEMIWPMVENLINDKVEHEILPIIKKNLPGMVANWDIKIDCNLGQHAPQLRNIRVLSRSGKIQPESLFAKKDHSTDNQIKSQIFEDSSRQSSTVTSGAEKTREKENKLSKLRKIAKRRRKLQVERYARELAEKQQQENRKNSYPPNTLMKSLSGVGNNGGRGSITNSDRSVFDENDSDDTDEDELLLEEVDPFGREERLNFRQDLDLLLDIALDFEKSGGYLHLIFGPAIVKVRNLMFKGEICVTLNHLFSGIPFVGGVSVYFHKPPNISFDIDLGGLARMAETLNPRPMIEAAISGSIANMLVLPNRMAWSISDSVKSHQFPFGLPLAEIQRPWPRGALEVQVLKCADIRGDDFQFSTIFTGRYTSDPYVIVSVGSQQYQTPYIGANCNPEWSSKNRFKFSVDFPQAQCLEIDIFDYDSFSGDDLLGKLCLPLWDLIDISVKEDKYYDWRMDLMEANLEQKEQAIFKDRFATMCMSKRKKDEVAKKEKAQLRKQRDHEKAKRQMAFANPMAGGIAGNPRGLVFNSAAIMNNAGGAGASGQKLLHRTANQLQKNTRDRHTPEGILEGIAEDIHMRKYTSERWYRLITVDEDGDGKPIYRVKDSKAKILLRITWQSAGFDYLLAEAEENRSFGEDAMGGYMLKYFPQYLMQGTKFSLRIGIDNISRVYGYMRVKVVIKVYPVVSGHCRVVRQRDREGVTLFETPVRGVVPLVDDIDVLTEIRHDIDMLKQHSVPSVIISEVLEVDLDLVDNLAYGKTDINYSNLVLLQDPRNVKIVFEVVGIDAVGSFQEYEFRRAVEAGELNEDGTPKIDEKQLKSTTRMDRISEATYQSSLHEELMENTIANMSQEERIMYDKQSKEERDRLEEEENRIKNEKEREAAQRKKDQERIYEERKKKASGDEDVGYICDINEGLIGKYTFDVSRVIRDKNHMVRLHSEIVPNTFLTGSIGLVMFQEDESGALFKKLDDVFGGGSAEKGWRSTGPPGGVVPPTTTLLGEKVRGCFGIGGKTEPGIHANTPGKGHITATQAPDPFGQEERGRLEKERKAAEKKSRAWCAPSSSAPKPSPSSTPNPSPGTGSRGPLTTGAVSHNTLPTKKEKPKKDKFMRGWCSPRAPDFNAVAAAHQASDAKEEKQQSGVAGRMARNASAVSANRAGSIASSGHSSIPITKANMKHMTPITSALSASTPPSVVGQSPVIGTPVSVMQMGTPISIPENVAVNGTVIGVSTPQKNSLKTSASTSTIDDRISIGAKKSMGAQGTLLQMQGALLDEDSETDQEDFDVCLHSLRLNNIETKSRFFKHLSLSKRRAKKNGGRDMVGNFSMNPQALNAQASSTMFGDNRGLSYHAGKEEEMRKAAFQRVGTGTFETAKKPKRGSENWVDSLVENFWVFIVDYVYNMMKSFAPKTAEVAENVLYGLPPPSHYYDQGWVNAILKEAWPLLQDVISEIIKEQVLPSIEAALPGAMKKGGILGGLNLDIECNLGDTPPQIQYVTADIQVDAVAGRRDLVIFADIEADLSDATVSVKVGSFEVSVQQLMVKGQLVIELNDLLCAPPFIGGIAIYFANNPTITFRFGGGLDLLHQINLYPIIEGAIFSVLGGLMVLPKRIVVPLNEYPVCEQSLRCADLVRPWPRGIMLLEVLQCIHLRGDDWNFGVIFNGKRTSDPYVQLTIGGVSVKTPVINANNDPEFSELFKKVKHESIEFNSDGFLIEKKDGILNKTKDVAGGVAGLVGRAVDGAIATVGNIKAKLTNEGGAKEDIPQVATLVANGATPDVTISEDAYSIINAEDSIELFAGFKGPDLGGNKFLFLIDNPDLQQLEISVYDDDLLSGDDKIAEASLLVNDLIVHGLGMGELPPAKSTEVFLAEYLEHRLPAGVVDHHLRRFALKKKHENEVGLISDIKETIKVRAANVGNLFKRPKDSSEIQSTPTTGTPGWSSAVDEDDPEIEDLDRFIQKLKKERADKERDVNKKLGSWRDVQSPTLNPSYYSYNSPEQSPSALSPSALSPCLNLDFLEQQGQMPTFQERKLERKSGRKSGRSSQTRIDERHYPSHMQKPNGTIQKVEKGQLVAPPAGDGASHRGPADRTLSPHPQIRGVNEDSPGKILANLHSPPHSPITPHTYAPTGNAIPGGFNASGGIRFQSSSSPSNFSSASSMSRPVDELELRQLAAKLVETNSFTTTPSAGTAHAEKRQRHEFYENLIVAPRRDLGFYDLNDEIFSHDPIVVKGRVTTEAEIFSSARGGVWDSNPSSNLNSKSGRQSSEHSTLNLANSSSTSSQKSFGYTMKGQYGSSKPLTSILGEHEMIYDGSDLHKKDSPVRGSSSGASGVSGPSGAFTGSGVYGELGRKSGVVSVWQKSHEQKIEERQRLSAEIEAREQRLLQQKQETDSKTWYKPSSWFGSSKEEEQKEQEMKEREKIASLKQDLATNVVDVLSPSVKINILGEAVREDDFMLSLQDPTELSNPSDVGSVIARNKQRQNMLGLGVGVQSALRHSLENSQGEDADALRSNDPSKANDQIDDLMESLHEPIARVVEWNKPSERANYPINVIEGKPGFDAVNRVPEVDDDTIQKTGSDHKKKGGKGVFAGLQNMLLNGIMGPASLNQTGRMRRKAGKNPEIREFRLVTICGAEDGSEIPELELLGEEAHEIIRRKTKKELKQLEEAGKKEGRSRDSIQMIQKAESLLATETDSLMCNTLYRGMMAQNETQLMAQNETHSISGVKQKPTKVTKVTRKAEMEAKQRAAIHEKKEKEKTKSKEEHGKTVDNDGSSDGEHESDNDFCPELHDARMQMRMVYRPLNFDYLKMNGGTYRNLSLPKVIPPNSVSAILRVSIQKLESVVNAKNIRLRIRCVPAVSPFTSRYHEDFSDNAQNEIILGPSKVCNPLLVNKFLKEDHALGGAVAENLVPEQILKLREAKLRRKIDLLVETRLKNDRLEKAKVRQMKELRGDSEGSGPHVKSGEGPIPKGSPGLKAKKAPSREMSDLSMNSHHGLVKFASQVSVREIEPVKYARQPKQEEFLQEKSPGQFSRAFLEKQAAKNKSDALGNIWGGRKVTLDTIADALNVDRDVVKAYAGEHIGGREVSDFGEAVFNDAIVFVLHDPRLATVQIDVLKVPDVEMKNDEYDNKAKSGKGADITKVMSDEKKTTKAMSDIPFASLEPKKAHSNAKSDGSASGGVSATTKRGASTHKKSEQATAKNCKIEKDLFDRLERNRLILNPGWTEPVLAKDREIQRQREQAAIQEREEIERKLVEEQNDDRGRIKKIVGMGADLTKKTADLTKAGIGAVKRLIQNKEKSEQTKQDPEHEHLIGSFTLDLRHLMDGRTNCIRLEKHPIPNLRQEKSKEDVQKKLLKLDKEQAMILRDQYNIQSEEAARELAENPLCTMYYERRFFEDDSPDNINFSRYDDHNDPVLQQYMEMQQNVSGFGFDVSTSSSGTTSSVTSAGQYNKNFSQGGYMMNGFHRGHTPASPASSALGRFASVQSRSISRATSRHLSGASAVSAFSSWQSGGPMMGSMIFKRAGSSLRSRSIVSRATSRGGMSARSGRSARGRVWTSQDIDSQTTLQSEFAEPMVMKLDAAFEVVLFGEKHQSTQTLEESYVRVARHNEHEAIAQQISDALPHATSAQSKTDHATSAQIKADNSKAGAPVASFRSKDSSLPDKLEPIAATGEPRNKHHLKHKNLKSEMDKLTIAEREAYMFGAHSDHRVHAVAEMRNEVQTQEEVRRRAKLEDGPDKSWTQHYDPEQRPYIRLDQLHTTYNAKEVERLENEKDLQWRPQKKPPIGTEENKERDGHGMSDATENDTGSDSGASESVSIRTSMRGSSIKDSPGHAIQSALSEIGTFTLSEIHLSHAKSPAHNYRPSGPAQRPSAARDAAPINEPELIEGLENSRKDENEVGDDVSDVKKIVSDEASKPRKSTSKRISATTISASKTATTISASKTATRISASKTATTISASKTTTTTVAEKSTAKPAEKSTAKSAPTAPRTPAIERRSSAHRIIMPHNFRSPDDFRSESPGTTSQTGNPRSSSTTLLKTPLRNSRSGSPQPKTTFGSSRVGAAPIGSSTAPKLTASIVSDISATNVSATSKASNLSATTSRASNLSPAAKSSDADFTTKKRITKKTRKSRSPSSGAAVVTDSNPLKLVVAPKVNNIKPSDSLAKTAMMRMMTPSTSKVAGGPSTKSGPPIKVAAGLKSDLKSGVLGKAAQSAQSPPKKGKNVKNLLGKRLSNSKSIGFLEVSPQIGVIDVTPKVSSNRTDSPQTGENYRVSEGYRLPDAPRSVSSKSKETNVMPSKETHIAPSRESNVLRWTDESNIAQSKETNVTSSKETKIAPSKETVGAALPVPMAIDRTVAAKTPPVRTTVAAHTPAVKSDITAASSAVAKIPTEMRRIPPVVVYTSPVTGTSTRDNASSAVKISSDMLNEDFGPMVIGASSPRERSERSGQPVERIDSVIESTLQKSTLQTVKVANERQTVENERQITTVDNLGRSIDPDVSTKSIDGLGRSIDVDDMPGLPVCMTRGSKFPIGLNSNANGIQSNANGKPINKSETGNVESMKDSMKDETGMLSATQRTLLAGPLDEVTFKTRSIHDHLMISEGTEDENSISHEKKDDLLGTTMV